MKTIKALITLEVTIEMDEAMTTPDRAAQGMAALAQYWLESEQRKPDAPWTEEEKDNGYRLVAQPRVGNHRLLSD